LAPGAWLLHGFALPVDRALAAAVEGVAAAAPFRHLETPGGFRMSVAMTNCGSCGWVSDRRGYRYESCDPLSGSPWPRMPDTFLALAGSAATEGGFPGFVPDACLINRYVPGARMTLHQDKDESNFQWPIVSVSLGLPAISLPCPMEDDDMPVGVQIVAARHRDHANAPRPVSRAHCAICPIRQTRLRWVSALCSTARGCGTC